MHATLVREAISRGAGPAPDANKCAAAVVAALQTVHKELGDVVGKAAAGALAAHAIHRSRSVVSWAMPPVASLSNPTLVALHEDLAGRTPSDCLQAGEILLSALVDHLVALIGERLTYRILNSAWGKSPFSPPLEIFVND